MGPSCKKIITLFNFEKIFLGYQYQRKKLIQDIRKGYVVAQFKNIRTLEGRKMEFIVCLGKNN